MVPAAKPGDEPVLYLERLALLVLDEQQLKRYFVAPAIYAVYMQVSDDTWRGILERRFEMMKTRYEIWLNTARGMIQRWLADDGAQTSAQKT
jgi:hypothetical protein